MKQPKEKALCNHEYSSEDSGELVCIKCNATFYNTTINDLIKQALSEANKELKSQLQEQRDDVIFLLNFINQLSDGYCDDGWEKFKELQKEYLKSKSPDNNAWNGQLSERQSLTNSGKSVTKQTGFQNPSERSSQKKGCGVIWKGNKSMRNFWKLPCNELGLCPSCKKVSEGKNE
jgi:hypothetical protein